MARVIADRERCMAAGHCVFGVPEVFDQGEDGLVVLLEQAPGEELAPAVRLAVSLCPSRALSVVE
ncbi:ferredoxin [Kitasatospora sp. NPDC006697]|uniref:ferredoxin n=1 Tax=Kitasatospora sp. NPDC006697 TaxID=3364020 RepID=UPI00369C70F7